jgi:hypothetical protein
MSDEPNHAAEFSPLKVWVTYPSDWNDLGDCSFELADGEDLSADSFAFVSDGYPTASILLVAIGIAGQCILLKGSVRDSQPVRQGRQLRIRVECELLERLEEGQIELAQFSAG